MPMELEHVREAREDFEQRLARFLNACVYVSAVTVSDADRAVTDCQSLSRLLASALGQAYVWQRATNPICAECAGRRAIAEEANPDA